MPPRRRNRSQPAQQQQQQQQQSPAPQPGPVYGPRSALTSFLREQGITSSPAHQFRPRTGQRLDTTQQDPTAANADAGPSSTTVATGNKRVATTGAPAAASKKQKKNKDGDGDGGFTLGGTPLAAPVPKKGRYEARPVGSFAVCAECGKKFTVSKYTASAPTRAGGVLCQPCTSESIEERAAFPGAAAAASGAPKRPKVQKKKSQNRVDETLFVPVPTLQQACLAVSPPFLLLCV